MRDTLVFRHAWLFGFDYRPLPNGRGSDRVIPNRTLRVDEALGNVFSVGYDGPVDSA